MNLQLIAALIKLRYQLMWAKTRSRNGKIALFAVGYFLLVLLAALLAAGGIAAGMAAVRRGKAEMVAQIVLTALFLQATLATVLIGFGVSTVFSEAELRRYPLAARERRLARHITGIADPFWFVVLALELGLALGLYGMGATGFWMGLLAVCGLMLCNYLLARLVALAVERLMVVKGGSVVLVAALFATSALPGVLAPALHKSAALREHFLKALHWTPPFGAAAAMAGAGTAGIYGLELLVFWGLALALAVVVLESRPPERHQAAARGPIRWENTYERVGSPFGPAYAPLVGNWLRFYVRNNRFRTLYLLTVPLAGFLTFQLGSQRGHSIGLFATALGTFPICGFLCTSRIAVNLFGYTGGAFRRFLLLPAEPAASLRAAGYASLLLAGTTLILASVAWIALAPVPWDARMMAMLIGSGVAGLFGLHAIGLWTTLYGPRRGNYNSSIGNDMSLAGNITIICGMFGSIAIPQFLARRDPSLVSPDNWWAVWLIAAAAIAFYFVSLRLTGRLFSGRREWLMAVVEGRT